MRFGNIVEPYFTSSIKKKDWKFIVTYKIETLLYKSLMFFQRALETSVLLMRTYFIGVFFESNVRAIEFVHVYIRKNDGQSIIVFPSN